MLQRRPRRADGPDDPRRESEHRLPRARRWQPERVDRGRVFPVRPFHLQRVPSFQISLTRNDVDRTSTSFQLLYGRLSDIFSRKTVLLACIAIFFIGSLAASLAQSAPQMIAFRALTGVGGGGLMTLAQTIVSDVVSLRDRGKYQGILVSVAIEREGICPDLW